MGRAAGRRHHLVWRLAAVCAVGAATVGGQAAVSAAGATSADQPAPAVRQAAVSRAPGGKASHLTLRRAGGAVELSDDGSGALLRSQSTTAGTGVVVEGAPDVDTTLTVDVGSGSLDVPGISYHGGAGGYNTLAVRAGAQPVQSTAKNAHDGTVTVGGATIAYSNLAPVDVTTNGQFTLNLNNAATKVNIVDGALSNGSPATEINDGGTNAFEKVDVQVGSLIVNGPGAAATWTIDNPSPFITNLQVLGRNGGETFNMVTTSVPTLLVANNTGADTFNLATTSNKATVVGSTGNDTFNVTAVSHELDVTGDGGSDAVNFGRQIVPGFKTLADIQGLVLLDEGSSGGHMSVTLDDTGRTARPSSHPDALLDVTGDASHPDVVGLPNSGIVAYDSSVNSLEFDGGMAGSTIEVNATSAPTTIKSGTGTNAVVVGGTAAAGPLTIDGQTGRNTVAFGDPSGLVLPDKILGAVSLLNVQLVSMDDRPDTQGRTVTLTDTGVTGLTSGAFTYDSNMMSVSVKGGSGADTFNATPSSHMEFTVDGGAPAPPASPGDTLDVDLTGTQNASLTVNGNSTGVWTFTNKGYVHFSQIETLLPAPTSISVTPASPSIVTGTTQQLAATGHYASAADADLTSIAAWSSSNQGIATVSPSGLATGVSPGSATITGSVGGVSGQANLTVTPNLAVTASPTDQTVTYGQSTTFSAAATGAPAPTVQWQVSTDGGATWNSIAGATATTYSFVPTVAQSGSLYRAVFSSTGGTVTTNTATLTVNAADLTVTAPSATMHYGDPVPALAPSYSGFVNGDTPASLTTQATCTTTATSSSPVGTYPVTCSGAVDPNYTFTYVPGLLRVGPAQLTVTADDKSIVYGAAIPPLTYKIAGFVNGDTASVVTGSASCTTTATAASPAGSYPVTCTAGNLSAPNYSFATPVPGSLTIAKHPATIGYTGGLFFATNPATPTSASVLLQAQVVQQANGAPGDLTKAAVRFLLYHSANTTMTTPDMIVPATVDSTGKASANPTLGIDNWTVIAQIDPANGFFSSPNADPQVVTVYQPTSGIFATGGGWIVDPSFQNLPVAISPSNNHGSFGFVVRYDKKGSPQGQAVYTFRGANGYDYVVKSTSWQGGGASFGSTTVSFGGKANVTVIDPSTGLVVAALSGGNYTYRVDATSGSSPTYATGIYSPSGSLYHQAGTPKSQIRLGGGNIVVHH